MNLADGAKTAVAEFYNNKGAFPKNNGSAGIASEGSVSGKYVTGVKVVNGAITATFGNESNSKLNSKILTLSPFDNVGSISWNCKNGASTTNKTNVDEAYLPTSCRK
jgi:type IV pilus assembly protein PilA